MPDQSLPPSEGWPVLHCATHEKPFPCPDCVAARSPERFEVTGNPESGRPEMVPSPNPLGGGWVRYSDYEKLEAERRRKEQIRESEVVEAHEHRTCHENLRRRAERQRDRANEALEEAEQRAANWKRRAESSNRSCDRARQEEG